MRYSIVPIAESNAQANFDSAVYALACAQVGCTDSIHGDWRQGDNHGERTWTNPCTGQLPIPTHVPDGTYTIQWVLYGWGNNGRVNSPYQACIDVRIAGGPLASEPTCPLWRGGDLSQHSDTTCAAWACSDPTYQGTCLNANACAGRQVFGIPSGLATCLETGTAPATWDLATTEAPDGAPNTFQASGGLANVSLASAGVLTSSDATTTAPAFVATMTLTQAAPTSSSSRLDVPLVLRRASFVLSVCISIMCMR